MFAFVLLVKESMPVWKHTGLACFDHNQKMQSIIGYISGFALFIVEWFTRLILLPENITS